MYGIGKVDKKAKSQKIGYGLKVQQTLVDKSKKWISVGGVFANKTQALTYAQQKFPGVKHHIEGIRVNPQPISFETEIRNDKSKGRRGASK